MEIEFRSYQPGDSFGITEMLSKLPYKRDTAYWTWMYQLLNTPAPLMSLAVVNENGVSRVVGYTAVAIKTVVIGGEEFCCGHGMHSLVDPEFRKYEYIMYEITANMHRYCSDRGVKCVFGFPNAVVRTYLQQLHEVVPIKLFNAMEYTYNKPLAAVTGYTLEENTLSIFEAIHRITILKEENRSRLFHFKKTPQYYYFRYFANPENTYEVKWVIKNKTVVGVVFLKNYINGNTTFGHLVEYIINSREINYEDLVKLVMAAFKGRVDKLAFWPVEKEFNDCLTKLSFEPTGFDTMFITRFIDQDFKEKYTEALHDFNSWSLQMGDSDAF